MNPPSNTKTTSLPPVSRVSIDVRYPDEDGTNKAALDAGGAITVKVRVNLKNIIKIDQVAETFTARFVYEFRYVDPALKDFRSEVRYIDNGKVETKTGVVVGMDRGERKLRLRCDDGDVLLAPTNIVNTSQPDWASGQYSAIPSSMTNMIGEEEVFFEKRTLEYCDDEGGHVSFTRKIQATFSEQFELQRMPFDRQLLRIKFVAEESVLRMQYLPEFEYCTISKKSKSCPLPIEWDWGVVPGRAEPTELRVFRPTEKAQWARFDVLIHVERKPWFYFWNVICVLFFITLCSSVTFTIPIDDVADRCSVLFAVLLTTVAYKLILTSWIPIKPYLTFLDQYILLSFTVQFLAVAEVATVAYTGMEVLERVTGAAYILWILCHVCFVCVVCVRKTCVTRPWNHVYNDNELESEEAFLKVPPKRPPGTSESDSLLQQQQQPLGAVIGSTTLE